MVFLGGILHFGVHSYHSFQIQLYEHILHIIYIYIYINKNKYIYIYILFTSLRDGNRPHRIVGLTQQGHDSGAERKVERRSWGAKSVVEWWVTKSLPPSPLSSLRSPLSSLPLPSTYFFLLFPLSSLLSPLSCILFPVRVPTQNPCSPRGKETKWEPKHQRCLWGKTHLHANKTASKGAWAELESRVDPTVIMRSCRMSRPGAGIWSHAPTVRQFPHANLQRLESWANPLY